MCDSILRLVHILFVHTCERVTGRGLRVCDISSRLDALEIEPEEEREEEIRTRWRPMDDARRSLNRRASSRYYVVGSWSLVRRSIANHTKLSRGKEVYTGYALISTRKGEIERNSRNNCCELLK